MVVNHTLGFINEEGEHMNNIENVWSHFETELRTQKGVMLKKMKTFVQEFTVFK